MIEPVEIAGLVVKPVSLASIEHALRNDLVQSHYREVCQDKRQVVDIDHAAYRAMDAAGVLACVAVYLGDKLLGYSVSVVQRLLHYDRIVAHNKALFLDPSVRAAGVGAALSEMTKALARERGASAVLWHAKPNTRLHAIMQRAAATGRVRVEEVNYVEDL